MLVLAIAGFVGFEATVVLSEEAKDPKRTIARATHWAVLLAGLLCGAVGVGDVGEHRAGQDRRGRPQSEQTDLVFALVAPHVPAALVNIGYVLFLTSVFAALLAFHAAVARYQFALGREGVLPAAWGRTHPRTGAPLLGSVTQSVLALAVLVRLRGHRRRSAGVPVRLADDRRRPGRADPDVGRVRRGDRVLRPQPPAGERLARPDRPAASRSCCSASSSRRPSIGLGDLLQVAADSPFQWLFPVAYAGCRAASVSSGR